MNKLVELKELQSQCKYMLLNLQKEYVGIFLCFHALYDIPVISIYKEGENSDNMYIVKNGIGYHTSKSINAELANEIILDIEKAFNEN